MARVFHEGRHAGAYIVGEVEFLARSLAIVAAGAVIEPGTVLAQVTATRKLVPLNPAGDDGSQTAFAINFDHVNAADADVPAVVTSRLTAINEAELLWPAGITDVQKAAALAQLETKNIIAR